MFPHPAQIILLSGPATNGSSEMAAITTKKPGMLI